MAEQVETNIENETTEIKDVHKKTKVKINIDALREKSSNKFQERIKSVHEAGQMFKNDIMEDFIDKIQESVERNYNKTYLYFWKTGKMSDNCDENEKQYYKTYNGMRPFDIINNYKKNEGKFILLKELSSEINEMYGTEKTKFYIKYDSLYDNKWVIYSRFYTPKKEDSN
jgi:hypothetical protein